MAEESVSVEGGAGGVKASATGSQTITFLLTALLGVWIWYVNFSQDTRAAERDGQRVIATKELTDAVKAQTKAIEALTYVTSLPDAEKKKLNLLEPESVRARRRDR